MRKEYKILICLIVFVISLFLLTASKSYSVSDNSTITSLVRSRINEIRSTPNTDISKITGNIYYVSLAGDDTNDGLSQTHAIKSISQLQKMLNAKTIKNGDAVLFRDGDTFRGNIILKDNNITLGSFGDISKGKPKIFGSEVDAKKEGSWVQVYTNIWKYQVNGQDKNFANDVGGIWFFCKSGNNNCDRVTTDGKTKYKFGDKQVSLDNITETEETVKQYLKSDLQFYHIGHDYSNASTHNGGALYVYSVGNPATRFDEIEINKGTNGIQVGNYSDVVIDNLELRYFGRHAVAINDVANVTVTNCEIAFIGGMVQKYNETGHWGLRLGNGIQSYGSVEDKNGYPVKDGYVARNNYIYEIYDAGLTFQYTAKAGKHSKVEKLTYDNNVVEYCSYNIEYWNSTEETTDAYQIQETYLGNIYFTNNILRYAGMGFTEVRPEHGYEALIKTWEGGGDSWNRVKNEFIIENNILDTTGQLRNSSNEMTGIWMLHIDATNKASMPKFRNNKFYNYKNRNLGWVGSSDNNKSFIPYNSMVKNNEGYFENNEFYVFDEVSRRTDKASGITGNATWTLDFKKQTLTISGTGAMADYTESSLPPWSQYYDYIKDIVIGENITHIGNFSFYNLAFVRNIYLNAKNVEDLSTDNYALAYLGRSTTGTKLIVGAEATRIPGLFTTPVTNTTSSRKSFAPNINDIEFKGSALTTIGRYALAYTSFESLFIPESVTSIGAAALFYNQGLKVVKLPDNLTTLSDSALASCYNLEVVILGTNTTTLKNNSLGKLNHLERLVITNPNFSFNPNINVFGATKANSEDEYPTVFPFKSEGIQFFGPATIEADILALQLLGYNVFYIPLTNYRPEIKGDGVNYYSMFNEIHYGESATYEAKALSNSSVNITGAKYVYKDRFKKKYLFDGVNINTSTNTVSNVFMDVELTGNTYNKTSKTIDAKNVLYLGNSFLIGWGTHGMGSTDVDTDYYYYMNQYLKSLNKDIKTYRIAINPWEEMKRSGEAVDRNTEVENLITQYNAKIDDPNNVDLFFIQLSENLNNTNFPERRENIDGSFDYMITRFKEAYPNAEIIVMYNTGTSQAVKDPLQSVCDKHNLKVIKYGYTGNRYRSFMGAKYYNSSNKVAYVTNEGVAWHPGDYGNLDIANTAIDYLKDHLDSDDVTITSTKYTITGHTIYAKPTTNYYMRNELIKNLASTHDYDIYVDGVKTDTNTTYIKTGSIIRIKDFEYKIIVKGDVTGDGSINLADISKLYNYYKKKVTLSGDYLEAGRLTNNTEISLGDVSKLYNFYKGKTSL